MFLVDLNNSMQELKQQERAEELKILTYLTGLVRAEYDQCRAAYGFLVDYDVLQAKINFAEIGVGSGIISIMLALKFPHAKIIAVDISKDALEIAKINIEKFLAVLHAALFKQEE